MAIGLASIATICYNNSMESPMCRAFCAFYKPGQEQLKCGTYSFLERNLSKREMELAMHWAQPIPPKKPADKDTDASIRAMVCEHCDFFKEDCDYRQGLDSPPCGGYTVIAGLLKTWS